MKYEVLLYYKYVAIDDPHKIHDVQRELCEKFGLKGRIIIAHNGINGTVEGTSDNTTSYISEMIRDQRFSDIVFKRSRGTGDAFPKLQVRVRNDLVSDKTSIWEVDPKIITGKYITSEQLHDWIRSGKKFYIMDMRNSYEHASGHFEGSILPPIENFRNLPDVLPELKKYNDRPIVTVCTGGIRCERASGLLIKHGFSDVYQLQDGIVTYMEKYPNEDFLGKLYVFDKRLVIGFETDSLKHEIIGRCVSCGSKSENYINCRNNICHRHFICCENCVDSDGMILCPSGCRGIERG